MTVQKNYMEVSWRRSRLSNPILEVHTWKARRPRLKILDTMVAVDMSSVSGSRGVGIQLLARSQGLRSLERVRCYRETATGFVIFLSALN